MALRSLFDVAAPAKLNLFLHVVGRRSDGYHLLQSVLVPIDWCDTLHFECRSDGRLLRHDLGDALPADDLCLRAARALQEASGTALGVDVSIDKRIPAGAGLGGGSSDAASTLLALNRLWALRWPRKRLQQLALRLGADVPFFLEGGPAVAEGIGEKLTPIDMPSRWFAVVKPPAPLATASIFQSPLLGRSDEADIVEGFAEAGLSDAGGGGAAHGAQHVWSYGRNDLQCAAEAVCNEVAPVARWLQERFGNSRMTGSGSAVFSRVQGGERPCTGLPERLPSGWAGKMCRGLARHPLDGWAD